MKKNKKVSLEDQDKEAGLRPQWRKFIDAYFRNNFNATQAYLDVYENIENERVAQSSASRLLSNAIIRAEIDARFEAQSVTEHWITASLKRVALKDDARSLNAAVRALEILARVKGMLKDPKSPDAFTAENPAIFLPVYTQEEKEKFELFARKGGRVYE